MALEGGVTSASFQGILAASNIAISTGGLLHVAGSIEQLVMNDLLSKKHRAGESGGTLVVDSTNSSASIRLSNTSFSYSSATLGSGGAVLLKGNFQAVQLQDLQATECSAGMNGGALMFQGVAQQLTVRNINVSLCNATGSGGGISMHGTMSSPVTIDSMWAQSNYAKAGGGAVAVSIPGGSMKLARSNFKANKAGVSGGVAQAEVGSM